MTALLISLGTLFLRESPVTYVQMDHRGKSYRFLNLCTHPIDVFVPDLGQPYCFEPSGLGALYSVEQESKMEGPFQVYKNSEGRVTIRPFIGGGKVTDDIDYTQALIEYVRSAEVPLILITNGVTAPGLKKLLSQLDNVKVYTPNSNPANAVKENGRIVYVMGFMAH